MSQRFDPLAPPARWLNCPRKAYNKIYEFVAFKTPLSSKFDVNVPVENRFTFEMLINSLKSDNIKLGLIVDLTKTDRFYDPATELTPHGIKHIKIKCSGHEETPTDEQTRDFINKCDAFLLRNPTLAIGVHCTHGFNRTGFMICSYLVEKYDCSIDAALRLFSKERPPGIYKQDYVNELYRRYGSEDEIPPKVAGAPNWDVEPEESKGEGDDGEDATADGEAEENGGPSKKRRKLETIKLNPQFAIPLDDVTPETETSYVSYIQQEVQKLCKWDQAGFPGSQPVSMDIKNVNFLRTKKYKVSWKADGTRYLMYIHNDKVFMLDRDNSVFSVTNLRFPRRKDLDKNLKSTLLDGEFVLDADPNDSEKKIPRFLIYDIIKFEGQDVGLTNFSTRLICIDKEIIQPRAEAIKHGKIDRSREPFGVRQKNFFPLNEAKKLLSEEFSKQITHGIDGLIFQPADDTDYYLPGKCETTLKWKPPEMNSVDFKLSVKTISRPQQGMLDEEVGELWVGGYNAPFSTIKVTKTLRKLNGKIIECKWNDKEKRWEFMRERTDKSYPNAYKTAMAVCGSIKYPVTTEHLLNLINEVESYRNQTRQSMPPPPPPPTFSGH